LLSVSASFAFERIVRITDGVLIEEEKLAQRIYRKVSLCILFLVDYSRGKSLFICLPLEDFFFYCASRNEPIDETCP